MTTKNADPIVVAVGGRIGSGKTEVAKLLAVRLRCQVASFGSTVREEAASLGLPMRRETLQSVGQRLIKDEPERLCRRTIEQVDWTHEASLVIEGLRHAAILPMVRTMVSPLPLFVAFLDVPDTVRYARIRARGRDEGRANRYDSHETELEACALKDEADVVLDASLELEEVVGQLEHQLEDRLRTKDW